MLATAFWTLCCTMPSYCSASFLFFFLTEPAIGPLMLLPARSARGISQSSASSEYWAMFSILISSSWGMKLSSTKFLSLSCWVRTEIVSTKSCLSNWNSCWRSLISACACWYLEKSFLSFLFLSSISSCCEENCCSKLMLCSSFSSSSLASWRSCWALISSSILAFWSSCSCLTACSMIWDPWTNFSSIALSFLTSLLWFSLALFCSSTFFWSSSISLRFSSSARFFWASISFLRSSTSLRIPSFSLASFSSISLIFSLSSTGTTFSTTFGSPACRIWPPIDIWSAFICPPCISSCAFSCIISSWNCLSIASFGSSLMCGLHWMFFARLAYLSVEIVSSKFQSAGPMFAHITVLVLPPRESCSSFVSLESL
mmetsp:Transcript_7571/g.11145  ORF Transcript_7571/g.11145 Transcript_7571/m.11145 type:complete len:371 (-) Transcript_7571:851-1963(-)